MKKIVERVVDFWEFTIWNSTTSAWYYIKNCIWRKHHLIRTGLPRGQWYDTDTRMLYGMMNLLVEFIDKEKPFEHIDWDYDDFHKGIRDEFLAIRAWWDNYQKRCEEIEQALTAWHDERFKDAGDKWLERMNESSTPEAERLSEIHNEMEEKLKEEETDMLIRLVKIKECLWT